jgi:hypothetical protein
MDLTNYVDNLRQEFLAAAEANGAEALALAERLVAPLDSSVRLNLLHALSNAAAEITSDLAPGSVEVRLRGLDPSFVVTSPAEYAYMGEAEAESSAEQVPIEDDGAPARINFRPSEQLKARIEEAAGRAGLSVNAWLVRTVTASLGATERRSERRAPQGGQHHSGWVR